jgi:signal transduction histidine kinase/HAMP domain-containing protein
MRPRALRHSIGTKIFAAFLAMGVLIGALGGYGYGVLSHAGDMVTGTYDGPLMAINYARAASVDFVQMQQRVLERKLAAPAARTALDGKIDELTSTFFDDLGVAQQRLSAADERKVVSDIRGLVTQWKAKWRKSERAKTDPEIDALDTAIMGKFDMLIELNADHSFVGRRKAVWSILSFKSSLIWFTATALLLAMLITAALARRIMHPLGSAVAAADRIAGGEFETPIPQAGKDETGILLKSMTVMQDNIRIMMDREKARAESAETRLAQAIETTREGVILVGPDGRVLLANKSVKDFFPSIAGRDLAGMDFGEASVIAQDNIMGDEILPTPQDLGMGRRARSLGHAERQLKDGRWIRSEGTRTSDGGFVFFISDFTAIKNREEDSHRAQKAAEAASAAKSRFLTNMSHELRTPLNAVIGFSEIIAGQLFGPLGHARYGEYATDIARSGRHLLDVINSVLEISRSETGKQNLNAETLDLRYLLRDCGRMIAEQCEAGQIAFALDDQDDPVMVYGEKAKLRQVFLNLLSNALKFTNAGGAVRVTIAAREDIVQITVADTGIGMTPDEIQIALTPFGQVDTRLERKYDGTGLGLPLARSLVELHGGSLKVESEKGAGTKVRVKLPRVPALEAKPPMAAVS